MGNYVYFIQRGDNGPIKIGRTGNIENRLAQLQTGSAETLRLLGSFAEVQGVTEKKFHLLLGKYRLEGEWFQNCGLVRQTARYGMRYLVAVTDGEKSWIEWRDYENGSSGFAFPNNSVIWSDGDSYLFAECEDWPGCHGNIMELHIAPPLMDDTMADRSPSFYFEPADRRTLRISTRGPREARQLLSALKSLVAYMEKELL